jgi:dihydropyrimidinase
MLSRAGHSIYSGLDVTGWPVTTIRRGEVVYEDGKVTGAPGSGTLVRRGQMRGL